MNSHILRDGFVLVFAMYYFIYSNNNICFPSSYMSDQKRLYYELEKPKNYVVFDLRKFMVFLVKFLHSICSTLILENAFKLVINQVPT